MTNYKELNKLRLNKELLTIYFSLDKKSPNYSEEWELMTVYQDFEKHEIKTEYISRWNSTYNKKIITKY